MVPAGKQILALLRPRLKSKKDRVSDLRLAPDPIFLLIVCSNHPARAGQHQLGKRLIEYRHKPKLQYLCLLALVLLLTLQEFRQRPKLNIREVRKSRHH